VRLIFLINSLPLNRKWIEMFNFVVIKFSLISTPLSLFLLVFFFFFYMSTKEGEGGFDRVSSASWSVIPSRLSYFLGTSLPFSKIFYSNTASPPTKCPLQTKPQTIKRQFFFLWEMSKVTPISLTFSNKYMEKQ